MKWYDIVVLYLSNRCLRQFRYRQYIPSPPPNVDTLDADDEWIVYDASMMDITCLAVFATTPYDMVADYLDWYYRVSHPRLVPPPRGEVRQVSDPVYNKGPSDPRLSFISHEMHRYLHCHEAEEDDYDFVKVFRALRVAQDGPVPQGGPITNAGMNDDD